MDTPAPPVNVCALALRGLPALAYTRFTAADAPPSHPLAVRAKWLAHPAAPHPAHLSAALALLAEKLPAALAAAPPAPPPAARPSKPAADNPKTAARRPQPRPPQLYVFAPRPVLLQAHALLAPAFTPAHTATWTPLSPAPDSDALLHAVHRALSRALQADGAVSLHNELVHPTARLAYALRLSLAPHQDPQVLIRVAVRRTALRPLTDADCALARGSSNSIHVLAGPTAIPATLARRPLAGDALSASVLARWREAGLLPQTHPSLPESAAQVTSSDQPSAPADPEDTAVVFLTISEDLDVPFPRACVLTAEPPVSSVTQHLPPSTAPAGKKGSASMSPIGVTNSKTLDQAAQRKQAKLAAAAMRSRKRPRSPSAQVDGTSGVVIKTELKKEPAVPAEDMLAASMERFAANAPTAQSLNNALALAKKDGASDPVPVLHHPLVDAIPPPSFHMPFEAKLENGKSTTNGATASETQNSPTAQEKSGAGAAGEHAASSSTFAQNGTVSKQDMGKNPQSATPLKQESEAQPAHSANGIDSFLQAGDTAKTQDVGFDAGPSMDMTDFTAFEDDVTEFFRDGMDERPSGADNTLPTTEEGALSTQIQSERGDRVAGQDGGLSQSNSDGNRLSRDARMDVDTDLQKSSSDAPGSVSQDENARLRSQDIMAMALSTLRKPSFGPTRPNDTIIGSKVTSFFEEDLAERRLVGLGPMGSIRKHHTRAKLRSKAFLAGVTYDAYSKPPAMPTSASGTSSFYALSSQLPYKIGTTECDSLKSEFYIPRRRLKAYRKLRSKGMLIQPTATNLHANSDESDTSDSDESGMLTARNGRRAESAEKLEDLTKAALMESLAQETGLLKEESGHDSNKDEDIAEYNPHKIFESVAVDCASVCMVLAASHCKAQRSGSPVSVDFPASEANESPVISREDDLPKVSVGVTTGKPSILSTLPKSQGVLQNGSPIGRTTTPNKKDRELQSLLTLLEMQAFSVKELDLFGDGESRDKTDRFALQRQETATLPGATGDEVNAATVRRVLMGLPRILETSRVFGNYNTAVREVDIETQSLKVLGPLPVEDVLGEKATIFTLDLPRICVGMNKEWVETHSGVLPLWEKAGLEPYSERKNVEYVAIAPKDMESDVKLFLRDVSAAYEECSFGRHAAMPFDAVTWIANSKSKSDPRGRLKNPELLSETDRAMSEQFHLAATGLCTKLAAVTREYRKSLNDTPRNIVVYIVSPFESGETAANVSLLRAVVPLVSGIPGTVPSTVTMVGSNQTTSSLPSAPWRSTHASKSVVSVTVRVVPREVVDRKLSGHAEIECLLERPLRPQLIKAVSFAVFSSIRSKRIRTSHVDGEVSGILSRAALMPDDLMSPMTPDTVAESPNGNATTPVSPKGGSSTDEGTGSPPSNVVSNSGAFLDQSSALTPSYLHEPAIVLSGVGKHTGQTDSNADIVLHLAYTYCDNSSRYVFAWTDQRGEMLDIATVPISKAALGPSRRKAFWCMWARGQRWKISYVQEVHTTVCKLGELSESEVGDWDWVIGKVCQGDSSAERRSDEPPNPKIVRRFPPMEQQGRGDDISDLYADHPTPATPGLSQPATTAGASKTAVSLDTKMPNVSSITLLNVCQADEHLLMEASGGKSNAEKRDFAIISESSLSQPAKGVQANAILARFEEAGVSAIELSILRHYGGEPQGEDMTDDRSPWDGSSAQSIASSIVTNFHALRFVGAPPSWPSERWLTIYPVHLDVVRRFEMHLGNVQKVIPLPSIAGQR